MPILVRSWNVFHGRTFPPGRKAYLRPAIELATKDSPDVVCLQELPRWSLSRLARWSGMAAFGVTTRRGIGRLGRRVTDLHHRALRSAFAGQANAILVADRLTASDCGRLVVSEAWAAEPRVSHAVRVVTGDDATLLVVNVHCSHSRGAAEELGRTIAFAEESSRAGEAIVIAGDFNVTAESPALRALASAGFSAPGPEIDHILVRGAPSSGLEVWPVERRIVDGRVLSDHPPVELRVG